MYGLTSILAGVTLLATPAADRSDDYYAAYARAESGHKLLLVDFGTGARFDAVRPDRLDRHVVCRVSADHRLPGESQQLIDHACFNALGGGPGLAVIDLTGGPHHGDVVSVLPQRHCSPDKVAALLALPPGTLTQRTLTWAFLIHPERPQSVYAAPCPRL
ncbi:MAG TPA: hypothetical protein VF170_07360, partial [Planctomycetaceae bacterium]